MKAVVRAKIGRIGLGNAHHVGIGYVCGAENSYLFHLGDGKFLQILIRHFPQGVGLITEILEPNPGLVWIGNHVRTPIVKDLQPPNQYIRLLNIDPVVLQSTAVGFADGQLVHQEADRNEVAILQAVSHFPDRHGGENIVRFETAPQSTITHGFDRGDCAPLDEETSGAPAEKNLSALVANQVGGMFPELPRTVFRVQKLFNQRGLSSLLLDGLIARGCKGLLDEMQNGCGERKTLDSLCSPFCTDLFAGNAPHLLGVRLEKRQVQLAAEAIDEKVVERLLQLAREESGPQVTDTDL